MAPSAVDQRVVMVCTGNICRSPVAEMLWRARLGDGITVASAGVQGLEGQPVSAPMASLLRREGLDPGAFRARYLTSRDVQDASLVLGMTRPHRSRAVSLSPTAVQRSFTLKEFARLAQRIPAEELEAAAGSASPGARLQALVALAGRRRAPVPAHEDDIDDPYQLADEVYARVFGEIRDAIDIIARAITPGGPHRVPGPLPEDFGR